MGECGCIYINPDWIAEDYEEEEIFNVDDNIKCKECCRYIEMGERRISCTYIDDEEMELCHSLCMDCKSIIDEFFCGDYKFGSVFEDLREHFGEMDGKVSSECLERLTPKAKSKVINLLDEIFEDINDEEVCEECFHCIHAQRTEYPSIVRCVLHLDDMFPWQSCQWWKQNDAY